ncbi:MAG: AAA-like domain-containing protein [Cyanobacteriota bacterium]
MTSSLPDCPFAAGAKITDPRFFIGRKEELNAITSWMTEAQPVSINVVGPRRIGKSSLLYHFFQIYQKRVPEPTRYLVIYLSLQDARCQSENDFYQAVARQLWHNLAVQGNPALIEPLRVQPFNRLAFCAAMGQYKRLGVLPVFCLDELGPLFRHPEEFDNGFFDNLRSLMESHVLMLIVASHRKLEFYQRRHKLTSAFFKRWQVLILGELTENEAKTLICLPASTVKGATPALNSQEQHLVQQWGGRHPYLLQLAASLLYEARQTQQDEGWAKAEFEKQARRVSKPVGVLPRRTLYLIIGIAGAIALGLLVLIVRNVLR